MSLVLAIQNDEAGIGLGLDEQPDLADIARGYLEPGGGFWVALDGGRVVGCLGLMPLGEDGGVLKKFFVEAEYRSRRVGLALYERLLERARGLGLSWIVLDTPSVATASHRFYERAGFRRVTADELPAEYHYPDRDSLLYLLRLDNVTSA